MAKVYGGDEDGDDGDVSVLRLFTTVGTNLHQKI